ncbi:MAG: PAS domain S-box protein [Promethearchaeota archaeon]
MIENNKYLHLLNKSNSKEENLQLLLQAVEQSTEGIAVSDLKGNLLYVNNKFATMHGYTSNELVGKNLSIFHTQEQIVAVDAANQQVTEIGEFNGEIWHMHRNGTAFPTLMHNSALKDERGEIIGFIGMARDITEQKKMEKELQKKTEEQALLLDNIETQIWYLTDRETYGSVNKAHAKFIGKKKSDLENKRIQEFRHQHEYKACIAGNQEVFEKKKQIHTEEWVANAKGENRLFSIIKTPKLDNNGNIEYVVCAAEDITEREKAKKEIVRAHSELDQIFNKSIPLVLVDKNFNIIRINNTFSSLFHTKKVEIIGKKCYELQKKPICHTLECPVRQILEGKDRYETEAEIKLSNDIKIPCIVTSYPYQNLEGNVIGVIINFVGISKRKEAEQALLESEKRLKLKLDFITSPDKELSDLSLTDLIDLDHLQTIQDAFAKANNVASLITDTDGNPITKASNFCKVCEIIRGTKKGNEQCIRSDKILGNEAKSLMKPIYEECHSCGFVDASAPIIVSGKHMANWLIGQSNVMGVDAKRIEEYAKEIGANVEEMLKAYSTMEQSSLEHFKKVLDLLWILARELSAIGYNNLKLAKDLEDLKKAGQELKKSEKTYRDLFNSSPSAIVLVDLKGSIVDCNPATKTISGFKKEDLIGKNFLKMDLFSGAELSMLVKTINNLIKGKETHRLEIKTKKRDGSLIWIMIRGTLINMGSQTLIQAIIHDITKRKKVEQELKEINRLKTELLRRTSHELKTPLISIKGFTELLLNLYKEKLDDEMISILDEINNGCLRLEKIVNNLLESSHLESGKLVFNPSTENLSLLIKSCVNELEGLTKLRNHTILSNIKENLITKLEKDRIREVISNLLINAIKYTLPNGIIRIKSEIKDYFIITSIEDNGIGLTEEEKKLIFKQFGKIERYGQGWDVGIEGTGLGLYISKKIVELHGGQIWMESEGRNKGSTFYFSLPFVKE